MKKRVVLLLTGLFIWMSSLLAQDVPSRVITAFKNGNAQELEEYFGDEVELSVTTATATVAKDKAEQILATFFAENSISGFEVKHQGKRDESGFLIGVLTTKKGNFRVNCFFRKLKSRYSIHQIRIDKTNE